jgi:hypothetical protein
MARSKYMRFLSLVTVLSDPIRQPDIIVKHCAYGHSVATMLNTCGVTTASHKYSITVASHATVVVAVPSTVQYPLNYKIRIYYLRLNLKV